MAMKPKEPNKYGPVYIDIPKIVIGTPMPNGVTCISYEHGWRVERVVTQEHAEKEIIRHSIRSTKLHLTIHQVIELKKKEDTIKKSYSGLAHAW
jgi:hypothetical protein